jgi:hypothetical protein
VTLSLHDEEILRRRVYGLVDEELMAEHRERPFGPHSPSLAEVLDFLRRNPDPELPRYLVLDDGEGFEIGLRAADRGGPPASLGGERLKTRAEAEHSVFLHRLADYGALRGELLGDRPTNSPQADRGALPSYRDGFAPQPEGGGAE